MESSVWFYTFSTAAQVIAALVGLFAVFVVYKIQDFSEPLNSIRDVIVRMLPYTSQNISGYKGRSVSEVKMFKDDELLVMLRELLDIQATEPQRFNAIDSDLNENNYEFFFRLVELKRNVLSDLKNVLSIGLGIIGIAVFSLVGTEFVIEQTMLRWTILILFLGLFLFFLSLIGKAVYLVATRDN